jgi:hypothetical protein
MVFLGGKVGWLIEDAGLELEAVAGHELSGFVDDS